MPTTQTFNGAPLCERLAMDPEACWRELLELAEQTLEPEEYDEEPEEGDDDQERVNADQLRMAELVIALRDWVRGGGFVPQDFKR